MGDLPPYNDYVNSPPVPTIHERMATALEELAAGERERTEAYDDHLRRREEAQQSYWDNRGASEVAHNVMAPEPRRRLRDRLQVPWALRDLLKATTMGFCACSGAVVAVHYVFGIRL